MCEHKELKITSFRFGVLEDCTDMKRNKEIRRRSRLEVVVEFLVKMFGRHLEMWILGLTVNPIEIIVGVMELDRFSKGDDAERRRRENTREYSQTMLTIRLYMAMVGHTTDRVILCLVCVCVCVPVYISKVVPSSNIMFSHLHSNVCFVVEEKVGILIAIP